MKLHYFDVYRDRDYLGQCVATDANDAIELFKSELGRYHVRYRCIWLASNANV
jgi:hypothetical protein